MAPKKQKKSFRSSVTPFRDWVGGIIHAGETVTFSLGMAELSVPTNRPYKLVSVQCQIASAQTANELQSMSRQSGLVQIEFFNPYSTGAATFDSGPLVIPSGGLVRRRINNRGAVEFPAGSKGPMCKLLAIKQSDDDRFQCRYVITFFFQLGPEIFVGVKADKMACPPDGPSTSAVSS